MKNKKWLGLIFVASVIVSFVGGFFIAKLFPNLPSAYNDDMFATIYEALDGNYLYDVDDNLHDAYVAQMESIIDTYAKANNDPYTRLSSVSLNVTPTTDEEFVGVGISLVFEGKNIRIISVYPGSAAEGKLYPNDLIVGYKEAGEEVYFDSFASSNVVLSKLSGTEGSSKTFIVDDPNGYRSLVEIVYKKILTPSIYQVPLDSNKLAVIKISSFSDETHILFRNILSDLENSTLKGDDKTLILDLRDNPGGSLLALHNSNDKKYPIGIIQQLLLNERETDKDFPAFTLTNSKGKTSDYYGNLSESKKYNIVVLVNENSASAAEVLAASLNTYGDYPLYGKPTYGKGVYQATTHLVDINDVRYSLTYTAGTWDYQNKLNVSNNPLNIINLDQDEIFNVERPVFNGHVEYDEYDASIILYQKFLRYYYNNTSLRIDGYFDTQTESLLSELQIDLGITVTGALDKETARAIDDYLTKELRKSPNPYNGLNGAAYDYTKDIQFLALLDLLNN